LQRLPIPSCGGENHHLRKSRRAKCALHWHSPEQKMPIFVSTCRPYSAPRVQPAAGVQGRRAGQAACRAGQACQGRAGVSGQGRRVRAHEGA